MGWLPAQLCRAAAVTGKRVVCFFMCLMSWDFLPLKGKGFVFRALRFPVYYAVVASQLSFFLGLAIFFFFFSVCSHSPFIVGWIVLCISSLFLCQSDTSCRSAAEYWTVTVVLTLVRLFLKRSSFPLGVQPSESITACIFYPKHSSVLIELSLQLSPRKRRGHGYTLLYRNTHCWVYLQCLKTM